MMCEYGCGNEAAYTLKNGKMCCSKNVASCPTIRKKISEKNKEVIKTPEWRENLSRGMKGRPAWNKGRKDYLTDEIRSKMGERNIGKDPWNKGKEGIYSNDTLDKMKKSSKNRKGSLSSNWRGGYHKRNIPTYNKFAIQISYAEECRRNVIDRNILDVKCAYCGGWFTPSITQVYERVRALNGVQAGEQRLYCSDKCKLECPIYRQIKYPKNYKPETSREVQPELRQLRFKIDNYICQRCKKCQDELETALHCHHIEGIRWEPLESADIDKVITLCKNCHLDVHKQNDCNYDDLKCKKGDKI